MAGVALAAVPAAFPQPSVTTTRCRDHADRVHVGKGSLVVCGRVEQVVFADHRHGWVLSVANCATDLGVRVYATSDGGESWGPPSEVGVVNCAAGSNAYMKVRGRGDVWIVMTAANGCSSEVARTFDGGHTWRSFRLPYCGGDVVFVDRRHGWYAGGFWGTYTPLFETQNGGRTWSMRLLPRPPAFAVHAPCLIDAPRFAGRQGSLHAFVRARRRYATAVYRTVDAGRHWRAAALGRGRAYGREPASVPWRDRWGEMLCPAVQPPR